MGGFGCNGTSSVSAGHGGFGGNGTSSVIGGNGGIGTSTDIVDDPSGDEIEEHN